MLSLGAGALLGGIATGIGGLIGGLKSADVSAEAARQNTEKQIAWERERSQNAHQWEIKDLEKAGINPILSAGGSGATTGGISPQLPDTSGITSAYQALGNGLNTGFNNFITAQQTKNDTDRVLNETKQTNSDLSMKRAQIELMLEEKLNKAVERKWINQKTATEIKNRAKLQSDMDLAQSNMMLNEQIRGRAEYEMEKLQKEIELIETEIEMAPTKKARIKLENDLTDKENKLFYAKEIANTVFRLGTMGLSLYGAYQANNAISAYKANQNRTMFTEMYNGKGKQVGQRVTYYK